MHNLTVEGIHTYYDLAGRTPVLVHNCMDPHLTDLRKADIEAKHKAGGSRVTDSKSLFDDDADLGTLAENAETFDAVYDAAQGKCTRICEAPNVIGKSDGVPTKVYTVVTDKYGDVWTMHPGLPRG